MSVLFLPNSKNRKLKNKIALKPMLAEVDFHYTQIEARNLFFLKLFREGFSFFLFNYQRVTIMCIKKSIKSVAE